jgi:hypothetical protein
MFDGITQLAFERENSMKFRETAAYKKYYQAFGEALSAYYEASGEGVGLESLMLAAYRWMKYIRQNNNAPMDRPIAAKELQEAIIEATNILDEPIEYCVPMYMEADALETLSYSAWIVLKETKEVKYCKHCKSWLNHLCKKHKEPSSVEDLFWCNGCKGYLSVPCTVHALNKYNTNDVQTMNPLRQAGLVHCKNCRGWLDKQCDRPGHGLGVEM